MDQAIDINIDDFANEINNESPQQMLEVGNAQYLQLNERQKTIVDLVLQIADGDPGTNLNKCIYI